MNNLDDRLLTLIMIGGKSRRMGGGIKSLMSFNNENIFDKIIKRLKPQTNNIIVNCNEHDVNLMKYNLTIIEDKKKGYLGPLAGIHSAMDWIKKYKPEIKWLITIPGDTPFIPNDLIDRFKRKLNSETKIILVKYKNVIYPTIGAWNVDLLENLDQKLNQGTRKIMAWAELHSIEFVEFSNDKYDPFFNINTLDDLNEAKDIEINFIKND